MPYHLVKEYSGWHSRKVVDFFVGFSKVVMRRYQHKMKYWMTFNEINNQHNWQHPLFGYFCPGVIFTEHEKPEETMYQVMHHQFVTSAKLVRLGHARHQSQFSDWLYDRHATDLSLFLPPGRRDAGAEGDASALCLQRRADARRLLSLHAERVGYQIQMEADDAETLRNGCADYVGFSYYTV